MIKAVFFDIDGTLVSFNTHKIPTSTIESINKLREKGIKVCIATGRPWLAIDNLGDLQFDAYITLNGAYCFVPQGEVIHREPIAKADVRALVDYVNNKQSFPCVFVRQNDCFSNYLNDVAHKVFETINISLKTMGKILPIEEAFEQDVFQMISFINIDEEKSLLPHLPGCKSARWSPLFTDIIGKDVSKSVGVDKVLQAFDIPLNQTMAFGDGGNDIAMLKHVNIGVAMGNASDNVKEHADYISSTVDEDGIFKALKHFNLI